MNKIWMIVRTHHVDSYDGWDEVESLEADYGFFLTHGSAEKFVATLDVKTQEAYSKYVADVERVNKLAEEKRQNYAKQKALVEAAGMEFLGSPGVSFHIHKATPDSFLEWSRRNGTDTYEIVQIDLHS